MYICRVDVVYVRMLMRNTTVTRLLITVASRNPKLSKAAYRVYRLIKAPPIYTARSTHTSGINADAQNVEEQ